MSKRFIDTELFDDPWFMDLSKDAKILWIYLITKCNHAGLIDVNEKLCKFQTGLKNIQTVYKELGNRLVTVSKQLIFIPKFIEFQYPDFPKSNVKQQASAIKLLLKYNLFNEENLTVNEGLLNSYEYDNGNVIVNVNVKREYIKKEFLSIFNRWLEYKKDKRQSYKNEDSIKTAYNKLYKFADGNPKIATEIVEQSLANNWDGMFKLKQDKTNSNHSPF